MPFEIVAEGPLWPYAAEDSRHTKGALVSDECAVWSRPQAVLLPDGNILYALTTVDPLAWAGSLNAKLAFRLMDRDFNLLDSWDFPTGEFYAGQFANMWMFRGLDHTVYVAIADESVAPPGTPGNNSRSFTTLDCRDSKIAHVHTYEHPYPQMNDFRRGLQEVFRLPEYNLIVSASGSEVISVRHNEILGYLDWGTADSPGLGVEPYGLEPDGLLRIGTTDYASGGIGRSWFYLDPVTGQFSFEPVIENRHETLVSMPSDPLAQDGWMMGATGFGAKRPIYLFELDADDYYIKGYPLALVDANGDTIAVTEADPDFILSNWSALHDVSTGDSEFFYAHHAYFERRGTPGSNWGVDWFTGFRMGWVRANEDGSHTWDQWDTPFDYIINPVSGKPDWDHFNFTLGSSITFDYLDGYVFVIINMLSGTDEWHYPPENPTGTSIDFTMTYGWLVKVNDGSPMHVWDYNSDEFKTIGQGVSKSAGRGQLNLKVDASSWHHEWTTQDDIDNPTALRYPLRINIAEDGEPAEWRVIAVMTPTE